MPTEITYDSFYYGDESNQFSFYRIPRELITGERFTKLSTDAKLLYGLLLDRMGLSAKNGWYDEDGRVYIYYTLNEIQADLNCGHEKAVKLLSELDTGKGFGLIERTKQGQGRPTKLYVKRFTTRTIPPKPVPQQDFSRLPKIGSQDFGKSNANYIKSNQPDFSQLNPSINPSCAFAQMRMDRYDCQRNVQEHIDYPLLCSRYSREDVDEVVTLIVDVLCSTKLTQRIGGEDIPTQQVQERFWSLDREHLQYVFDCLRRNTTQIFNIRAYLLTSLYNAPVTISSFNRAAVQHDFGL